MGGNLGRTLTGNEGKARGRFFQTSKGKGESQRKNAVGSERLFYIHISSDAMEPPPVQNGSYGRFTDGEGPGDPGKD